MFFLGDLKCIASAQNIRLWAFVECAGNNKLGDASLSSPRWIYNGERVTNFAIVVFCLNIHVCTLALRFWLLSIPMENHREDTTCKNSHGSHSCTWFYFKTIFRQKPFKGKIAPSIHHWLLVRRTCCYVDFFRLYCIKEFLEGKCLYG